MEFNIVELSRQSSNVFNVTSTLPWEWNFHEMICWVVVAIQFTLVPHTHSILLSSSSLLIIYLNLIPSSTWTWHHRDKISESDIFMETKSVTNFLRDFWILLSDSHNIRLRFVTCYPNCFDVTIKLKITVSNYSVNDELIDDFDAWKCLHNQ